MPSFLPSFWPWCQTPIDFEELGNKIDSLSGKISKFQEEVDNDEEEDDEEDEEQKK